MGLRAELEASEAARNDLQQRAMRNINDATLRNRTEIRKRLARLNDWADKHYADDDKELQRAWETTAEKLNRGLDTIMKANCDRLSRSLTVSTLLGEH